MVNRYEIKGLNVNCGGVTCYSEDFVIRVVFGAGNKLFFIDRKTVTNDSSNMKLPQMVGEWEDVNSIKLYNLLIENDTDYMDLE